MPVAIAGSYPGHLAKEYLNIGGTYDTPTWVAIARVEDVDNGDERGKTEFKEKGTDFAKTIPGRRSISVAFKYRRKRGTDAVYDELLAAYISETQNCVDYMALNNTAATSGAVGWRAPMAVTKFAESRPDEGPVEVDVELSLIENEIPAGNTDAGDPWEYEAVTIA